MKQYLSLILGGNNGSILVPRFLFVKNGKIVYKSATRPSNIEQLAVQIKATFRNVM